MVVVVHAGPELPSVENAWGGKGAGTMCARFSRCLWVALIGSATGWGSLCHVCVVVEASPASAAAVVVQTIKCGLLSRCYFLGWNPRVGGDVLPAPGAWPSHPRGPCRR